jgi:hypothetical protein
MQSTVILKASTKARLKLFDRFRANINKLLTLFLMAAPFLKLRAIALALRVGLSQPLVI